HDVALAVADRVWAREVDAVVARCAAPHAVGGLPVLVVGIPRGDRAVGVVGAVIRGAERQALRPEKIREPPLDSLVLRHGVPAARDPGLVVAEGEVEARPYERPEG